MCALQLVKSKRRMNLETLPLPKTCSILMPLQAFYSIRNNTSWKQAKGLFYYPTSNFAERSSCLCDGISPLQRLLGSVLQMDAGVTPTIYQTLCQYYGNFK